MDANDYSNDGRMAERREDRPSDMPVKTKDGVLIAEMTHYRGEHIPHIGELMVFQVVDCVDEWNEYEVIQVATVVGRDCKAPHVGKLVCFEITVKPVSKEAKEEVKGLPGYWKNLFDHWEMEMNVPINETRQRSEEN